MLNPQWLRSFAALNEHGSFTRAADVLGLTQAAVSQHVRHLEDEHGTLVLRHPRRIEVTPAGKAVLAYWQDMREAHECLQQRLAEQTSMDGHVRLITPGSVGMLLYPFLLDLQVEKPGLIVQHRFAPDAEVEEGVLSGIWDLGVLPFRPDSERLFSSQFCREPLELVVPAGETVNDWSDLQRLGFVGHPDGKAIATRLFARWFPGNPGVETLPCKGFINQVALIPEPVARGLGFTVLPRYARLAYPHQERIQVLDLGPQVWDTLWLIFRQDWPLTSRARYVVERLNSRSCMVDGYLKPVG
ncbi:LysR family transcriptional regulator [Parathalassolituus penaei]|uniref:LysR family transcriptional regulator n=1 Tax=Parathalassolituus penaei TaxID=2997323 RepID=A0A9X3ECP8_9GAMM|nr:LysR family transcriptional regulator [Parathalassolituus penaei]MCY0964721.1 LysR family transcriptional regulator [Parathalassolituus penaei]